MGYSFYYPHILYGFFDLTHCDCTLSTEWLQEHYPNIVCLASDVYKNYKCDAVIGIYCSINKDGQVVYKPEEYEELMKFKEKYEQWHGRSVDELGFHTAISGDYQLAEGEYELEEEDDE